MSRQVKLLEDRVGLTLLERSNRHVQLTSAGESFYRSALDILQRSEHAVLTARQAERGDTGEVVLGFVPSASLLFVPLIAQAMADRIPNVSLTLIEMMGYEVIEALRAGRIDLGLTRMERPIGEIKRIRAVSEPFIVALPKSHPLALSDNLSMADFDGEPYISYTTDRGGYLKETLSALFSACEILPDKKMEASQTHTVISLVNQGLGFAIVPRSAEVMQMKNIAYHEINLPKQFRSDIYLLSRTSRKSRASDRVRKLIFDVLKQYRVLS